MIGHPAAAAVAALDGAAADLPNVACLGPSTPKERDLTFGPPVARTVLPVFNLHPLGSPVSYPASLQQAEAITCYVNLICSQTQLIVLTDEESDVRVLQLKFGLDHVSLHMISLGLGRAVEQVYLALSQ